MSPQATSAWSKMFGYFAYRRDEFLAHYHKRSNVESTFSMIKRKFGDFVRSKTDVAMVNEVLCKVLAHNLVVLNSGSPRFLRRNSLLPQNSPGERGSEAKPGRPATGFASNPASGSEF
jgi:hypothetical protein